MKWSDRNLPYSGHQKLLIYNYLLSVIKRISALHPKKKSDSVFIMNFILNDIYYEPNTFSSSQEHDWFINELKNNPFLFDFVVTETQKIQEMPNIFEASNINVEDLERKKAKAFSEEIQAYILKHPEIPHFYFNTLNAEEVKEATHDFVKKNYKKFKSPRSMVEYKYECILKVKMLLEKELNIKTKIAATQKSLFLQEENNAFEINITKWGNFPLVPIAPQKPTLFCIIDDISLRVLGTALPENISRCSNQDFLFSEKENNTMPNLTALAFFEEDLFRKEVLQ